MSSAGDLKPEGIERAFADSGFVVTGELATTLFLAERLGKPLLLEGPPGVGKTEVGKLWAELHGAGLVRLQGAGGLRGGRRVRVPSGRRGIILNFGYRRGWLGIAQHDALVGGGRGGRGGSRLLLDLGRRLRLDVAHVPVGITALTSGCGGPGRKR